MNRRRFLALTGPLGGIVAAGCLGASSPAGDEGTDDSDGELEPLAGGDGVSGRTYHRYAELAALLQSADDLESILFAFDESRRDAVSAYVEGTDFEAESIVFYTTSLPDSAYELAFDGATVRDDRIVADFASERDEDVGGVGAAVVPVGALVRVPTTDPPSLLVVERDDYTTSNRYEIHLERLSDDELGDLLAESELAEQSGIADLSAVPSDARSPIRSAIEDGERDLETVPEPLARTVTDHTYVRDGDDYYELTAAFPEYVLTSEIHDRDAVDAEPADETVLDLRDLRDESDVAYDMVVAAMSGEARRVALPTALERALEEYDYVWRSLTFVELDVEVDDPGAPYSLRATSVSRTDVLAALDDSGTLIAFDELSEAAQREVRTTLEGEDENAHTVTNPPALFESNPVRTLEAELDQWQSYLVVDVYRPVITDSVGDAERY